MPNSLAVLLVADADEHAAAVGAALQSLETPAIRFNLSDLRRVTMSTQPGALDLLVDGDWWRCDAATTVWWHRSGQVDTTDLASDEAQLARDEGPHVMRGGLAGASCRWVDEPFITARAEHKLYQLAVARGLHLTVPASMVTSDVAGARRFAEGRRIVTKALSPGIGIAPFTGEIHPNDLDYLVTAPALLQELIDADADLRVVTIGPEAWAWLREREPDTVDWRAVDPHGGGFVRLYDSELEQSAVRLTSALGLSMSIQDWLKVGRERIVLEVNPQGQFLFLAGAAEIVPMALAQHLTRLGGTPGRWPLARNRIQADFLTKNKAPDSDGVIAPTFPEPTWIAEVAEYPGAVEVARRAHDGAVAGAKTAEDKARSLLQTGLALLTITLALGTFQLSFALHRSWPWLFILTPISCALALLVIACFEAQQVDRVGKYHQVKAADLSGSALRSSNRAIVAGEEEGRHLAAWTSAKKHTDLMQARAWFTRGLAALLLAALLAGICKAGTQKAASHKLPIQSTTTLPTK